MINFEKKQVKIISIVIAAVFLLSVVAIGIAQYSSALSTPSSSNVGVVSYQEIISASPAMVKVNQEMQAEQQKVIAEFNKKAPSMSDKERADFVLKLREQMAKKQEALMAPILNNIKSSIQAVANAKGLAVVLDKREVVYGGQDITQDVLGRMQQQAK